MPSKLVNRVGFWSALVLLLLGVAYIGVLGGTMLSGVGFFPPEPYQTVLHALILLTAPLMVFLWAVLHTAAPDERKLFSLASLALITAFATLTATNRFVALTVVRQSLAAGNTAGLQWFMPYEWPSVMLAIEILGWGFFFGLACLCLAPAFPAPGLERAISWTLFITGALSLCSAIGQVVNSPALSLPGVVGWGPGLSVAVALITVWFRRRAGVGLPLGERYPTPPGNV